MSRPTNTDSAKLTTVTISAPRKAAPNPSTWNRKPKRSDVALVSHSMMAFSTKVKRPSVTMKNGSVRMNRIGRITALSAPNTRVTANRSGHSPSNEMPGTVRMATQSAAASAARRS